MYTHQFGRVSGGLSVLVAEKQIYPVWERGGALGDLWVKAEVEFVINSTFQVHEPIAPLTTSHKVVTFYYSAVMKSYLIYWTCPNQILFVAAIRDYAYGGIAIDDIVLSPECRVSNGTL